MVCGWYVGAMCTYFYTRISRISLLQKGNCIHKNTPNRCSVSLIIAGFYKTFAFDRWILYCVLQTRNRNVFRYFFSFLLFWECTILNRYQIISVFSSNDWNEVSNSSWSYDNQSLSYTYTNISDVQFGDQSAKKKKEKKNIIIVIEGNNLRKKLKCSMWNLVDLSIASGSHRTLTKPFGKWAPFTIRIKRMSLKSLNDRSSIGSEFNGRASHVR